MIEVAPSTFSRVVNYGIVPLSKVVIRFADYFDVSIGFLLGKTDIPTFYKTENPVYFYDRLEALAKKKGIKNQSALATKTHIPRQCFFDWKQKRSYPSLALLEYLADYFEVSIDYLVGRSDE